MGAKQSNTKKCAKCVMWMTVKWMVKLRDGAGVGERGGVPREGKESREKGRSPERRGWHTINTDTYSLA